MKTAVAVGLVFLSACASTVKREPARSGGGEGTSGSPAATGAAPSAPAGAATSESDKATKSASPSLVLTPVPSPQSTVIPPLDDPDEVGDQIIQAERQIRSESTSPAAYVRLGRIQQAAYRKLVANPDFRQRVLQQAPADLRPALEANIRAGQELSSLTKPATRIPSWKIVQPPPPEVLRGYYTEAEKQFGIPWQYLAAIHLVETRMGRIRGTSSAGAQGPMQFIPSTWARYGRGDINDPEDAILAAGRYLKAAGAPSSMGKALYAYNHSQKYVDAVTAYADQMMQNERTYLAYYEWQVYVKTTSGDVLLEVGYGA